MSCQTCGKPLVGRQKMYCSVTCRNVPLGKKTGGHNRLGMTKTCEECGAEFHVTPSRLALYNVRACSRACLGTIQSRERSGTFQMGAANPMYKDGRAPKSYRRNLKDACERCGAAANLLIHHQDENRHNNAPANLETLCHRCHQRHHQCWKHLPTA